MKALVKDKPERGVSLLERDIPKVGRNEVLVKVRAAAVCGSDVHFYRWNEFAQAHLTLPRTIGHEFAGDVVEVGEGVENLAVGDRVAGETHVPCGHCYQCTTGLQHICRDMKILGLHVEGSFAEYIAIPAVCGWKMDDSISYDIGSTMEPFTIGVHAFHKIKLAGKRVGVTGCGPIGVYAQAVAKYSGAGIVIGTDISDERLAIAKTMGTDVLLNPRKCDVVAEINKVTGGHGLDVLVELSGSEEALAQGLKALRRGGQVSLIGIFSKFPTVDLVEGVIYKEATVYGMTGRVMWDNWWTSQDILTSGRIDISPVITHRFPLEEYDEAFELAEKGACGKIIFTF